MKVELGKEVVDKITGFTGVVTGRVEYISGCNQLLVQPPVKRDGGDWVSSQWFDEDRVTVSSKPPLKLTITAPGFDRPALRR